MQADIEGAVRVARNARAFTWTWAQDDIERFALDVGWTVLDQGDYGSASLSTTLRVNLNRGSSYSNRRYIRGTAGRDESLERLTANITDVTRHPNEMLTAALSSSFDLLAERLTREFGPSNHFEPKPEAEIGWVDRNVVINFVAHKTYLLLEIVNPRYWMERHEFDDEDAD
ncbi:DUF6301 family protein [Nocardia sp. NPDC051981]|uniref:DUF6301 family protein n=1 Tax=Nocardia sp. NPDC051981 TaxID=3155417 RepID=UPI00341BE2F5